MTLKKREFVNVLFSISIYKPCFYTKSEAIFEKFLLL